MILKFFNTAIVWFVKNPSSRIIYRLTRDQLVIDDKLNHQLQETFDSFIMILGGLIILNVLNAGPMLLVTIVLLIYMVFVLR